MNEPDPVQAGSELSESEIAPYEELIAKQRVARKRRLLFGTLGVVVILGGGGYLASVRANAASQELLQQRWSDLNQCLIGEQQPDARQANRRVRNTQLAAMSLAPAKRGKPGSKPWPQRCAQIAHALSEAAAGDQPDSPLIGPATELASALERTESHTEDLSALVDAVWQQSGAIPFITAGADVPPALPAANPRTLDSLEEGARFLPGMIGLARLRPEPTPSRRLRFLVDDKEQNQLPALCEASADGSQLDCKTLQPALRKLSPGLNLWGTTDDGAIPHVFAGERGKAGIYRSSDALRVADGLTYGAYARADGWLFRTIWKQEKSEVWYWSRSPEGKESSKKALEYEEVGNPYYNSGLFWNWLVYKAYRKKRGIQVLVREVSKTGKLGSEQAIGELRERSLVESKDTPHVAACRMKEGLVLRIKGSREQYLAFHTENGWLPPVTARGRTGVLTCHDGEAFTVRLSKNERGGKYWPDVQLNRCTPAQCTGGSTSFRTLLKETPDLAPNDKDNITAVELNGKLLLLWGGGERGGLRMRYAAIDQLARTPDDVVFDDLIEKQKPARSSTLIATRLLPGPGFALLFLSTSRGVFVYSVDKSGKLKPVKTTFSQ